MSARTTPAGEASFVGVLAAHERLDEIFALHQELLLLREPELPLEVLAAYKKLLLEHMQHEEQLLFPIFEREPAHPRWPLLLYQGQHKKLLGLLDSCLAALERAKSRGRLERAFVIALLERETTFKHLAEHHDGAERQGFFPALDAKASDEERRQLPARCRAEFAAAVDEVAPLLERARARLLAQP